MGEALLEWAGFDAASSCTGWDAVERWVIEVEYRVSAIVGCVLAVTAHTVVAAIEYWRVERVELY